MEQIESWGKKKKVRARISLKEKLSEKKEVVKRQSAAGMERQKIDKEMCYMIRKNNMLLKKTTKVLTKILN